MTPATTMDREAVYQLFASESDREARRRMESLTSVLALIPVCSWAWASVIVALAELMGVL